MNHSGNATKSNENRAKSAQSCATSQVRQQMEEMVEDRPLSVVMLSFGVGLGIGLAIGSAIAVATHTEPKAHLAQRMGQQFLDAISKAVPDSVSQRFHS